MEIRQLKTFHVVATLMSFHGAAKALHYAQSTVSAQIQALEESLDVKLFERLGKRIFLTDAGSKLLDYASKMVELSEEARAEVSDCGQAHGSLKVRMPESLVMRFGSELISRFAAAFPEVRLSLTSCAYHGLQEDLRKGVTDLAFLLAESFTSSNLEMTVLGTERVVLVGGRGHELVGRLAVPFLEMAGQTLFLSTSDCSTRRVLETLLAERHVAPARIVEMSSLGGLLRCVAAGDGLTLLPEPLAREEAAAGRLAVVQWEEGAFEVARMMIRHQEKWLSPALSGFMDIARGVLATA